MCVWGAQVERFRVVIDKQDAELTALARGSGSGGAGGGGGDGDPLRHDASAALTHGGGGGHSGDSGGGAISGLPSHVEVSFRRQLRDAEAKTCQVEAINEELKHEVHKLQQQIGGYRQAAQLGNIAKIEREAKRYGTFERLMGKLAVFDLIYPQVQRIRGRNEAQAV